MSLAVTGPAYLAIVAIDPVDSAVDPVDSGDPAAVDPVYYAVGSVDYVDPVVNYICM